MKSKTFKAVYGCGILLAALSGANVYSQPQDQQQGQQGQHQGDHPRPPQAAIDACNGKSEGDKVQFTGRNGETISSTCVKIGDVLAAAKPGSKRPDGGGQQGGGQPPRGGNQSGPQ